MLQKANRRSINSKFPIKMVQIILIQMPKIITNQHTFKNPGGFLMFCFFYELFGGSIDQHMYVPPTHRPWAWFSTLVVLGSSEILKIWYLEEVTQLMGACCWGESWSMGPFFCFKPARMWVSSFIMPTSCTASPQASELQKRVITHPNTGNVSWYNLSFHVHGFIGGILSQWKSDPHKHCSDL